MKSGALLLFLLSILFLVSQSNAAALSDCSTFTSSGNSAASISILNLPLNLIGISLLGLLVSINVVAIGYILSKIIPSTGVSSWLNDEMLEIAKSAILIVAIFSILAFAGNVASILAQPGVQLGTYPNSIFLLVTDACNYLQSVSGISSGSVISGPLPNSFSTTFNYLFSLSSTIGALNSISFGVQSPFPIPPVFTQGWLESGFTYAPYQNTMLESSPTTGSYESMLNDIFSFIAFPMSLLILIQQALLPTIVVLGIAVLIPLGIALRAFPFIRGIGGTFVAIGIASVIIYPALLVFLNGPVTNALAFGSYAANQPASCSSLAPECWLQGWFDGATQNIAAITSGVSDGFQSTGTIYPALNGILYYDFYLILQFLLFITDLAIAFPLADTIARSLGGTISLQLGGKLKLA